MELRHIRFFVMAAEECHFGQAAECLHIAQPHFPWQIKDLENHLCVVHEAAGPSIPGSFVAAGFGVALAPASVQDLRITGALVAGRCDRAGGAVVATRADDSSPQLTRVLARTLSLLGAV